MNEFKKIQKRQEYLAGQLIYLEEQQRIIIQQQKLILMRIDAL